MSIQKNVIVIIFVMCVLTFFTYPAMAVDTESCKECHGYVKPLSPTNITKDCSICHNHATHQDSPSTRVPTEVHPNHQGSNSPLTNPKCTTCHRVPGCTNCHNSHEIVQSVKANLVDPLNTSNCIGCHGRLPQPYGHGNNRDALPKSSHSWMNCKTCHVNVYVNGKGTEFDLHFKDMFVTPIEGSINLCKICHSFYYFQLKNGKHGDSSKKCVDCHNPHTTDTTGKILTDKGSTDNSTNVSIQIDSAESWITTKVPILKNPYMLFVILIIIGVAVAEYYLSKHEEGKKVAFNMVKFQEDEDTLNTLEVELSNQDINAVRYILEINGVNILGMTMTKEGGRDEDVTYKYVIFINIDRLLDIDILVEKISAMDGVKSAIFTDRYEL